MGKFQDYIKNEEACSFLEENKEYDNAVAYLYQRDIPISSIKSEIEIAYGPISSGEIYRSLKRNQITPSRRTKPYRDDVVYFGNCGLGFDEIAKLTGYSKKQVENILKTNVKNTQNDHIIE